MPLRPDMEPKDFLAIILRRKWMILFTILFILFGASVYCVVTPEKFKSSTTILVIPQKVPEGYVHTTVSIKIEDRLATIQQQVMSRTRLVAVMDELGLFKSDRKKLPVEEVVDGMRKRIDIQVRKNDAFTLSFSHENPQTAMLTASRLASFFIDENLKSREQQAVGTAEFLDSQLQDVKTRLESAEEKVRLYKMRFMGELPQQMQANLQVLSRLQEQLRANNEAIRTAEERKVFIESQASSLENQIRDFERPPVVVPVPVGSSTQGEVDDAPPVAQGPDPAASSVRELEAKRSRLEDLSGKFTDRYPEVLRLKSEVLQLEEKIAGIRRSQGTTSVNSLQAQPGGKKRGNNSVPPVHPPATVIASKEREEARRLRAQAASLEIEIPNLKKALAEILRSIAAVEAKVGQSPKREQEMIALTRDYDNMRASYDDLLKKKMQADISQNLEKRQKGEQFQILDPANLPEEPYVPNRKMVFLIAIVVALGLGFGGALLREVFNPSLTTVDDFRHYFNDLTILAVIPVLHDRDYAHRESIRKVAIMSTMAIFISSVVGFLILFGERIRIILFSGRG